MTLNSHYTESTALVLKSLCTEISELAAIPGITLTPDTLGNTLEDLYASTHLIGLEVLKR